MKRWTWAIAAVLVVVAILLFVAFGSEASAARIALGGTAFAGAVVIVEILRHVHDVQDRERAAAIKLAGAAWLARRTCESLVNVYAKGKRGLGWAVWMSGRPSYQSLESRFREVLDLAAATEAMTKPAQEAFESFIAFADRINELAAPLHHSGIEPEANIAREAYKHLRRATESLEKIAPRRPHELPVLSVPAEEGETG